MFDYVNLTEEKINHLESETPDALAAAGMMIVRGIRKNILTQEEGLTQINNLLIAILSQD